MVFRTKWTELQTVIQYPALSDTIYMAFLKNFGRRAVCGVYWCLLTLFRLSEDWSHIRNGSTQLGYRSSLFETHPCVMLDLIGGAGHSLVYAWRVMGQI